METTSKEQLLYHNEVMRAMYHRINNVHKRPLHAGQISISKALFVQKARVIQAQFGRSAGKTEALLFIAWTYALLNSGSSIYIITPHRKQGKDIYWASGRMQTYGPQEYVEQHKDSELRVIFKNGSVITIDGCENYEALRGIKPTLVLYDEFQHHSREFHVEVMQPNLVGANVSLVVMGTPPKRDCFYVEFREQLLSEIAEGDTTRAYFELPSWCNPSLNKEELEKTKVRLFKSGDEKVWYREYEGKLIFGGEDAVFPQWDPKKHIRKHELIMKLLERDMHKLRWFTICDPGTTTVFAVLFAAYNPNTSQIFILDEIYESDRKQTDVMTMWGRIVHKEKELYPHAPDRTWRRVYDEAAAWFAREVSSNFGENMQSTEKGRFKKEQNVSIVKSLMAEDNCLFVSDRLTKLPWEIDNFVTDEDGDFPDNHDHLLDCLFYLMAASNFRFVEQVREDGMVAIFDRDGIPVRNRNVQHDNIEKVDWTETIIDSSLYEDFMYDA